MSMGLEIALCITYGAGYLLTWRPLFRGMFKGMYQPDWVDVVMCAFGATCLAALAWWLIWPAIIVRHVAARRDWTAKEFGDRLSGTSRADKLKAREAAVAERERRISAMERELEVA